MFKLILFWNFALRFSVSVDFQTKLFDFKKLQRYSVYFFAKLLNIYKNAKQQTYFSYLLPKFTKPVTF
jgi:hypothetical protein